MLRVVRTIAERLASAIAEDRPPCPACDTLGSMVAAVQAREDEALDEVARLKAKLRHPDRTEPRVDVEPRVVPVDELEGRIRTLTRIVDTMSGMLTEAHVETESLRRRVAELLAEREEAKSDDVAERVVLHLLDHVAPEEEEVQS